MIELHISRLMCYGQHKRSQSVNIEAYKLLWTLTFIGIFGYTLDRVFQIFGRSYIHGNGVPINPCNCQQISVDIYLYMSMFVFVYVLCVCVRISFPFCFLLLKQIYLLSTKTVQHHWSVH